MSEYTTTQGDTWDLISYKVYDGDDGQQDILIDANFAERNRVIFPAGVTLVIPEMPSTATATGSLPPWRTT